jgi:hypothetical protein
MAIPAISFGLTGSFQTGQVEGRQSVVFGASLSRVPETASLLEGA